MRAAMVLLVLADHPARSFKSSTSCMSVCGCRSHRLCSTVHSLWHNCTGYPSLVYFCRPIIARKATFVNLFLESAYQFGRRGGRLCPPAERSALTKIHGKFATFIGPTESSAPTADQAALQLTIKEAAENPALVIHPWPTGTGTDTALRRSGRRSRSAPSCCFRWE